MSFSVKSNLISKPIGTTKNVSNSPVDLTLGRKMACAGTAACVADLATFPFDVAKVRLQMARNGAAVGLASTKQVASSGLFGTLLHMARREGLASWWNGIIPGLQRQCVFASIRIGLYDNIKDFYSYRLGVGQNASSVMAVRILSGITSGAIAISIAQPTDVVKVRMQAQAHSAGGPGSSLAMYRSIYRNSGLAGLWTGLLPNMARNSIVNATELVCYDSIKQLLMDMAGMRDGLACHFSAGFSAGFMATLVASPIDVVKTRVMSGTGGSVWTATRTLAKESGFFGFYKGFTPSFMRLGTWNICMFVTFEQLKKLSAQSNFGLSEILRNRPKAPVLIIEEKKAYKLN